MVSIHTAIQPATRSKISRGDEEIRRFFQEFIPKSPNPRKLNRLPKLVAVGRPRILIRRLLINLRERQRLLGQVLSLALTLYAPDQNRSGQTKPHHNQPGPGLRRPIDTGIGQGGDR